MISIFMNEKEKEVQNALGLLKKYSGYVKAQDRIHYDVYEVQDVTMEGAKKQLNEVVEKAQRKSKGPLKLVFIVDETEKLRDWASSNIKS